MAADLIASDRNNKIKGNYKQESDKHKKEELSVNISEELSALKSADNKGLKKVNFKDIDEVKQRTYDYIEACSLAGVYPSLLGLCSHGFIISRQAMYLHMRNHPNDETTEFLERVSDVFANILINQSLYNNANPVQAIFQLKNHFGHTDKTEVNITASTGQEQTTEELYAAVDCLPE